MMTWSKKNYWSCLRWEQSTVCMPQGYEFSWAIDFSLCWAASHCILAPFGWVATLSLISRGPSPMIFLGWIPCTVHWWSPVLALVGTQSIIGDRLVDQRDHSCVSEVPFSGLWPEKGIAGVRLSLVHLKSGKSTLDVHSLADALPHYTLVRCRSRWIDWIQD